MCKRKVNKGTKSSQRRLILLLDSGMGDLQVDRMFYFPRVHLETSSNECVFYIHQSDSRFRTSSEIHVMGLFHTSSGRFFSSAGNHMKPARTSHFWEMPAVQLKMYQEISDRICCSWGSIFVVLRCKNQDFHQVETDLMLWVFSVFRSPVLNRVWRSVFYVYLQCRGNGGF